MPLPSAVVFDLDDTLHDTRGIEAETLVALCTAVREELPEADDATFGDRFRAQRDVFYPRVLTGEWDIPTYRRAHLAATCAPWGEPSEVLFAAAHRLRDDQLERARFVEHAVELLRALRGAGVRTALLTNGPSWMQRRKVELLGLEPELDAIGISEELGVAKPDPAAFSGALGLIDARPEEAVMVGDNVEWDVRGALSAGLLGAVWVAGEHAAEETPPGAVRVTRLADVPAALEAFAASPGA